MGNSSGSTSTKCRTHGSEITDIDSVPLPNTARKLTFGRPYFSEFSFADLVSSFSSRSFGSFGSQRSSQSTASVSRPWSRVSRRQWSEKTLSNPLICSKTAWPVPCIESMFLPEFKIRDDISEASFTVIANISTGAFGRVHKVVMRHTLDVYAMKVLSKAQIIASGAVEQVKDEVKIQRMCGHHPFVVSCPFYWQARRYLFIVSDYVPGGELLRLLQDHGPLPEPLTQIYVAELAIVLDFLHNAGIIYRDLKLENILLDARGHIQLIDFGLSKWLKYGARTRTVCGTMQYIAPEILQLQPYGHAVDWWSLGVVMVCMVTGRGPFHCCVGDTGQLQPLAELDCSPGTKDLILRLLTAEPDKRLKSLAAIKRTAFFKDFNFEDIHNRTLPVLHKSHQTSDTSQQCADTAFQDF